MVHFPAVYSIRQLVCEHVFREVIYLRCLTAGWVRARERQYMAMCMGMHHALG